MSRVSRKSELSPSITKGSDNIDLGKNSGVDMGRKSQPSITSGGIGITQEVGNVGGVSVGVGVGVEISPVNLGISVDATEGTISVATGVEVPGGLLGISGGIEVDINTGEIIGGSIGGEIGGVGINVSNSTKGGLGVEFTLQIPFTPIEFSLGLGFPPKNSTPSPTPSPTSSSETTFRTNWTKPVLPSGDPSKNCILVLAFDTRQISWYHDSSLYYDYQTIGNGSFNSETTAAIGQRDVIRHYPPKAIERLEPVFLKGTFNLSNARENRTFLGVFSINLQLESGIYSNELVYYSGKEDKLYDFLNNSKEIHFEEVQEATSQLYKFVRNKTYKIIYSTCSISDDSPPPLPTPTPTPTPRPGRFPNPPPKRRNMNECCREAIALARINRRFLQELMIMMGRPLDTKGNLIAIPANARFFGEPVERIKTPIENISDPEKEVITFSNYYQLQMYQLQQQINLDVGIDPQSFIPPEGKVQNPYYQRDSEESLKTNAQPEIDKTGNKRELVIGEDIKVNSLTQQQQYIFEALKRLEYLFPIGELSDAKFDKSLIIPGAVGELKVHNLIHFQEFLAQYFNATLGDPKIPIKVEDNNALKAGKQEAIFRHFSIAQMIRELYKVTLESGDDINAIMETGIRDFRTNLANRIQIVQAVEMLQALVEDSGMLESQDFIPLKLDGDPYAGKWKAGMGFEPDADLDSNEEAATEKLMRATLKNFEAQVKVIRRDKRENSDIRDLLIQLAEMFIRSTSIPATKEGIEKALAAAKFKTQVDMALTRSQVKRAVAASRTRTKKRKKA